jgi:hypothetical protein
VLPQGLRDGSHLFSQALTKDFQGSPSPVCWWPTLMRVYWASCFQSMWIHFKLSLKATRSREKKLSCLSQVTYLGMILKGQTHFLSPEQIKPILGYPLPKTLC